MENKEKELLISTLSSVMDAFASVAGQHIELVLHDLSQPDSSVLKIINGHISGRQVGSSLFDGPENDSGFLGLLDQGAAETHSTPALFTDYSTVNARGVRLRSSTVCFRDDEGKVAFSLCLNADNTAVESALRSLSAMLPARGAEEKKDGIGLEDKMNEIIAACIPPDGQLRAGATKKEKVGVVRRLQDRGLFIVRGGVEKAAKALGVSRYTIYNYLDEIKKTD